MRALLYSWTSCSFCARARALLERHGIEYREVVLDGDKERLRSLQETFGARTMPLVLLDGEPLAGLEALERALAEDQD